MVRRTIKLSEARRNPEVNNADRKDSTAQALVPYIAKKKGDLPQYFVSFRGQTGEGDKKGIERMDAPNIKPEYDTPVGLYAYPLTIDWFYSKKDNKNKISDFQTHHSEVYNIYKYDLQTHVGIIVKDGNVEFMNTSSEAIVKRFTELSAGSPALAILSETNTKKLLRGMRLALIQQFRSADKKLEFSQAGFKALRALGIDYVLCLNDDFVHGNEPFQIVFLSKKGVTLVAQNRNRNVARDKLTGDEELENQHKDKAVQALLGNLSQALVLHNTNKPYNAALYGVPVNDPNLFVFEQYEAKDCGFYMLEDIRGNSRQTFAYPLYEGEKIEVSRLPIPKLFAIIASIKNAISRRKKKDEQLKDILAAHFTSSRSKAGTVFHLLSSGKGYIDFTKPQPSPMGNITDVSLRNNTTFTVELEGQHTPTPIEQSDDMYWAIYSAICNNFGLEPGFRAPESSLDEDAPYTVPKNYSFFNRSN